MVAEGHAPAEALAPVLVPAQRQSYFDPDLFSDTDDDMSNNNEMRNGLAVGSSEGDQEQIFQVNSDWVSNWERVDEDVMKKWKFKSMGEAKDAASHTLFLNEYSFFGRKEKGSNGHFVCKRCSNQEGRGFKVKQKRNKGNPITFYTIELFGKHTEDCEAKREKDKVDNGCEVTVDKKSGAIKILNAVMKSPRYIKRYKVLTAFNDPKSNRNTQNIQGRRHGKKGVNNTLIYGSNQQILNAKEESSGSRRSCTSGSTSTGAGASSKTIVF